MVVISELLIEAPKSKIGEQIKISGYKIIFAHLDSLTNEIYNLSDPRSGVNIEKPVKKGDIIGYTDHSGYCIGNILNGSHLHYEINKLMYNDQKGKYEYNALSKNDIDKLIY